MRDAKTTEERNKIQQEFQEKNTRGALVPKFLAFVEKYPKDPATVDALTWIVTNTSGPGQMSENRTKVLDILVRDHVASDKVGKICQLMSFLLDPPSDRFLHAVMEKNKSADVRAEAALALAQITSQKAMIVKRLKDDPDMAKQLEKCAGQGHGRRLEVGRSRQAGSRRRATLQRDRREARRGHEAGAHRRPLPDAVDVRRQIRRITRAIAARERHAARSARPSVPDLGSDAQEPGRRNRDDRSERGRQDPRGSRETLRVPPSRSSPT